MAGIRPTWDSFENMFYDIAEGCPSRAGEGPNNCAMQQPNAVYPGCSLDNCAHMYWLQMYTEHQCKKESIRDKEDEFGGVWRGLGK